MAETTNALDFVTDATTGQSASLLELAQKVHDDYVEKGRQKAEELEFDAQTKHDELTKSAKEFHDITILEAESAAASIVEDAQLTAFSTVSDAKRQADSILAGIEGTKLKLEASVLKLQEFEAAYRSQLQALVAGAQATLAVAQLVVEDETLPDSSSAEDDEDPEVQESDAETVNYHLDVNPGPAYFDDSVADDDVAEVSDIKAGEENADVEVISVDDSESTTSEEIASEDPEDDSAEATDYTLTEEVAPKVEHYTLDDTAESTSYDPIAKTASINSETVASILAASGLNDNTITDEGHAKDDANKVDKK